MNEQIAPSDVDTGQRPASLYRRIDTGVIAVNRWLLIVGLSLMSIIIFVEVVLRYTAHTPLPWAEEVARYLMLWITFIGIGPVFRIGGHIAIDGLEAMLPVTGGTILRAINMLLMLGFVLFLIFSGIQYAIRTAVQTTPVTNVPFTWVAASLPVGFALSLWHIAAVVAPYIAAKRFDHSDDMDPAEVGSL